MCMFGDDCFKNALAMSGGGDGHSDADGSGVGGINPRVIGYSVGEIKRLFRSSKKRFKSPAIESLMDGVGGDESEAFGFTITHEFGGLLPPEHDEVGGFGNTALPCLTKGFGVAIAKSFAHPGGTDEGWIADDVIRLRPFSASWIGVVEDYAAG